MHKSWDQCKWPDVSASGPGRLWFLCVNLHIHVNSLVFQPPGLGDHEFYVWIRIMNPEILVNYLVFQPPGFSLQAWTLRFLYRNLSIPVNYLVYQFPGLGDYDFYMNLEIQINYLDFQPPGLGDYFFKICKSRNPDKLLGFSASRPARLQIL